MRKLSAIMSAIFLVFIFGILAIHQLGYRVNISDSIPRGLYRIASSSNFKNQYVIFCPDGRSTFKDANQRGYIASGHCSSGLGYLMKKVVAIAGDVISVTDKGVIVNSVLLPYSKPLLNDGVGKPLHQWRTNNYQLKQDEILTMTDQDKWSFDGRYYGLIKARQIIGVLTPVWVNLLMQSNYTINKELSHA
jgi:conjugative transfer signal peptidase TraF